MEDWRRLLSSSPNNEQRASDLREYPEGDRPEVITKGIFTAVKLAMDAVNEKPQDQMRVKYAMEHLEFCQAMAIVQEFHAVLDEKGEQYGR